MSRQGFFPGGNGRPRSDYNDNQERYDQQQQYSDRRPHNDRRERDFPDSRISSMPRRDEPLRRDEPPRDERDSRVPRDGAPPRRDGNFDRRPREDSRFGDRDEPPRRRVEAPPHHNPQPREPGRRDRRSPMRHRSDKSGNRIIADNRRPNDAHTPDLPPLSKAASEAILAASKLPKGAVGVDFHVSPIHVAHSLVVGTFCVHSPEYSDHLGVMLRTGAVIHEPIEDDTTSRDDRRFIVMAPSPNVWNSFWERFSILAFDFADDIGKLLQFEHFYRYLAKDANSGRLIAPRFHNRTVIPVSDNKHLNSMRFQRNHAQFLAPHIANGLLQLLDENGYNKNLIALLSLAESFGAVRTLMFRNRDSVSITHSTAKASAAFCAHVRRCGVTLVNCVDPSPGSPAQPTFVIGKASTVCPPVPPGYPALRHGNGTLVRRYDRHAAGEAYQCTSHPTAGSNNTLVLGPKVELRTALVQAVFQNMFKSSSIEYDPTGKFFTIEFPTAEAAVMAHHFLHRPFQVIFGLSLDFLHPQQWYTPFHLVRLPQIE